ncbi:MAG: leucine-rich repeat domain-containing protein, partial [Lachnospiraceae bacterium]|nr:leucine-rich repeat domain-containing protein [Lachnospiraceae bacterium]
YAVNVGTGADVLLGSRTITIKEAEDKGDNAVALENNLEKATVSGIVNKNYTGKAQGQSNMLVKIGNRILAKNTDYKVSYSNNTNLGTATVKISGTGEYEGSIKKTFQIKVVRNKTYTIDTMKYKMYYPATDGTGRVALAGTTKSNASLTSLSVPSKVKIGGKVFHVTVIEKKAFKGKTRLKKVVVGNSVNTIGEQAFAKCTSLAAVSVGTGLRRISKQAFYGCKQLSRMTVKSTQLCLVAYQAIYNIKKTAVIAIPAKKLASYKNEFSKRTGYKTTMKLKKK